MTGAIIQRIRNCSITGFWFAISAAFYLPRNANPSMSRLGSNYFTVCNTCGGPGHSASNCALKEHYHAQAQRQVAQGSRDPEILKEVYGAKKKVLS